MFELDNGEDKFRKVVVLCVCVCMCVCVCLCFFKRRLTSKRMKMENEKEKRKLYSLKIRKYHLSILGLNLNIIYSLRV